MDTRHEAKTTTRRMELRAALFDLDGVVAKTAQVHAAAWKKVFDRFLKRRARRLGTAFQAFDPKRDYFALVDGRPRPAGIRSFLEARGIELPEGKSGDGLDADSISGLGKAKDVAFHEVLARRGVEADPATVALVEALKDQRFKVAVASPSRNCSEVLRAVGLEDLFDAQADGNTLVELNLHGKPEPDLLIEATKRLGVTPAETVLFEHAISGVQAGRAGGFGLVVGVARDGEARALREHGADLAVADMAEATVPALVEWFASQQAIPSLRVGWASFASRLNGRRPAVCLDYDGTLTPIADSPELAVLSDPMRERVARLAGLCPVAIISGRDRADVEARVGIDGLVYAGSHGFDIAGGGIEHVPEILGSGIPELMETVGAALAGQLAGIPGALVEVKRYGISAHYRLVTPDRVMDIKEAVEEAIAGEPRLKCTPGKKVFEIRPNVAWDKGQALLWLLKALHLDADDVLPIYIGDDTTDEDAFRAVRGMGIAILESERPRRSDAGYRLAGPDEVGWFLDQLADLLEE
ncbi:MAG: trehalose-phosphatase [Alphaproteobacteria bacterium]